MLRLLLVIALLAAALGAALASDEAEPRADVVYSEAVDPFTLDPQRMSYNQDFRLCYALYEGLVRWDNETFEILPAAAESWEVSPDGRAHTFQLRAGARWSNGEPVRASDFVYAWRRAILPDTAADYTALFFHIEGAEDFFNWRSEAMERYAERPPDERTAEAASALWERTLRRFEETVGIRALDERTFQVALARPTPFFLDLCAFGTFHPVHPPTLERFVDLDPQSGRIRQRHAWTKPAHLVANGPYRLARWRFKRDMLLERSPTFHDQARIRSDRILRLVIANPNTATLAYDTGGVDWVEEVLVDYLPEMLRQVERGERDDLIRVPSFGTYFWSFNCTDRLADGRENPFFDARVRRAFAMAANKRDLVEKVRRLGEPVARTFIPPASIRGYDPDRSLEGPPHDPARAAAALAEAGWINRDDDPTPENEAGEEFPVVEMLCSTGSYHEEIALAMGAMWEDALGVRTRVVAKESKIYKDDLKKRNFMVARGGWYGDYGDPTTFLDIHRTGDGNNDRGFSDPVYDALLDRAARRRDAGERMAILERAEQYLLTEAVPIITIFHYVHSYLWDPDEMAGLTRHPRRTQYLWQIGRRR